MIWWLYAGFCLLSLHGQILHCSPGCVEMICMLRWVCQYHFLLLPGSRLVLMPRCFAMIAFFSCNWMNAAVWFMLSTCTVARVGFFVSPAAMFFATDFTDLHGCFFACSKGFCHHKARMIPCGNVFLAREPWSRKGSSAVIFFCHRHRSFECSFACCNGFATAATD